MRHSLLLYDHLSIADFFKGGIGICTRQSMVEGALVMARPEGRERSAEPAEHVKTGESVASTATYGVWCSSRGTSPGGTGGIR